MTHLCSFSNVCLISPETGKRDEVDESNAARVFSSYLQETLVEQRTAVEEHMQTFFMSHLELHSNSDLPVSKLFLYWISKESENRKKLVKESLMIISH